jgi:hypothetical protein
MARCKYCRKYAGFWKKFHPECQERHDRAMAQIPLFFPKFFQSDLPIDRFTELLRGAAEGSFVRKNELTELAAQGLSNVAKNILDQRLLTAADVERMSDVARSLKPRTLTRDIIPHDTFAKVDVLQSLRDGNIPNLVSVAGPMPIELGQGETVIWIFNYVSSFGEPAAAEKPPAGAKKAPAEGEVAPVPLALQSGAYYGPSAFERARLPAARVPQDADGDMVVTDRNLFFLTSTAEPRRIPIAKIIALSAYANGIHIVCDESIPDRVQTFGLDDAWFAANMLLGLVLLARR